MPAHFWFGDRSKPTYTIYMHKLEKKRPKQVASARKSSSKFGVKGPPKRPSKWSWETDWNHPRRVDAKTFERARKGRGGVSSKYFDYENTPLQRVDELICEFMGEPKPDIKRDSPFYMAMHELGFWTLYNHGGSYIEERHVKLMHERGVLWFWGDKPHDFIGPLFVNEKYPARSDRCLTEGEMARRHALIDWVFLHKWRFGASG